MVSVFVRVLVLVCDCVFGCLLVFVWLLALVGGDQFGFAGLRFCVFVVVCLGVGCMKYLGVGCTFICETNMATAARTRGQSSLAQSNTDTADMHYIT